MASRISSARQLCATHESGHAGCKLTVRIHAWLQATDERQETTEKDADASATMAYYVRTWHASGCDEKYCRIPVEVWESASVGLATRAGRVSR